MSEKVITMVKWKVFHYALKWSGVRSRQGQKFFVRFKQVVKIGRRILTFIFSSGTLTLNHTIADPGGDRSSDRIAQWRVFQGEKIKGKNSTPNFMWRFLEKLFFNRSNKICALVGSNSQPFVCKVIRFPLHHG